ncbi:MAG: hypothetical protein IPP53_03970 [Bacteroidetes bacterium]|nr:hypothetical protein [Bacteroidota bacterium]
MLSLKSNSHGTVFAVDKRLAHRAIRRRLWHFSGSTFTTPTLNSNTTYYVESEMVLVAKALEHQ